MGVKIRQRSMAEGEIAFYIDTYHRDFGRFSTRTGLRVNPKERKLFKEAAAKAEEIRRQVEKDFERDPAGLFGRKAKTAGDFIEFFAAYAEDRKRQPVYYNTLTHLRGCFGGAVPFSSVNVGWVERFKAYLLAIETVRQNTAGSYLSVLKTAIRLAFRQGYLEIDFTGRVQSIKKVEVERNFLSFEELRRLSEASCSSEMIKQAFLFSCFAGLRISDIERLAWDKLSIVDGTPFISFRQQKTKGVERLPISEQALQTLHAVKDLHAVYAPGGSDKVFILPRRDAINKALRAWGAGIGLTWDLHFHAARHTFATLALTQGIDLYTVSKLLGHREIATTQIYGQIVDTKKIDAVNRLPVLGLPAGRSSVISALDAEGLKIASALRLEADGTGRYLLDGRSYTAVELVLEVQNDKQ